MTARRVVVVGGPSVTPKSGLLSIGDGDWLWNGPGAWAGLGLLPDAISSGCLYAVQRKFNY